MKTMTLLALLCCASFAVAGTNDPPECLLQFISDYKLSTSSGGGVREIARFDQYVGRMYPDKAQIKIDGLWFTVPRNVVMVKDWKVPSPTPKP